MGHNCCCVVNCKNNGSNSRCKFYIFPTVAWKLEQRNKWIAAVKRKNVDGSPWTPKPHDTICSEHFIGGKKSEEQASPSYIPTIFPKAYRKKQVNDSHVLARYTRLKKRRTTKVSGTTSNQEDNGSKPPDESQEVGLSTVSETESVLFAKHIAIQMRHLPKSVCNPLMREINNLVDGKRNVDSLSVDLPETSSVFEIVFVKNEMEIGEFVVQD